MVLGAYGMYIIYSIRDWSKAWKSPALLLYFLKKNKAPGKQVWSGVCISGCFGNYPQGTNISPKKWHFEDDFPVPKVGYVNPLEGKSHTIVRSFNCNGYNRWVFCTVNCKLRWFFYFWSLSAAPCNSSANGVLLTPTQRISHGPFHESPSHGAVGAGRLDVEQFDEPKWFRHEHCHSSRKQGGHAWLQGWLLCLEGDFELRRSGTLA